MNLEPTAQQRDLATSARRFLAAELPLSGLESRAAAGKPAEVAWQEMSRLGWFEIGVPVTHGGAGGSLADQAVLFRELGRALAAGPLLGTVLAVSVAALAGRDDLARSLMSGETTAALAEPWRDPSAAVSAAGVRGRYTMLDDHRASLVTVVTPADACLVSAGAVRLTARVLPAPDPSVPVALAHLSDVPVQVALDSSDRAEMIRARGQVLAAALLVGILEAVRDLSVTYVSARQQFGKPIGSFQAVKHRCADMAVRAEAAGSLLWLAALSVQSAELDAAPGALPGSGRRADGDVDRSGALRLAASVKALASEYAVASAHDNVQNHGGMGFTAECSAHLYVKRALAWSATLGSPDTLLSEVAR